MQLECKNLNIVTVAKRVFTLTPNSDPKLLAGLQQQGQHSLAAGYGTIGYEPNVSYFFGVPRAIEPGGVAFDIPMIYVSEVGDGDAEKRKQFVMQTGMISSALEHATPEQMFASQDPADPKPDAISAVKALQKASAAGQRIYHLTQENMGSTLGAIHHDTATILEIRSALLAGKEVITHTNAVSVPGWSGAGYIILDPDTGVGAYKIAGGGNGGFFYVGAAYATLLVVALHDGLAGAGPAALAFALAMLVTIVAVWELYGAIWGEEAQNCFVAGLAVGLFGAGLLTRLVGMPLVAANGKTAAIIAALAAVDVNLYKGEGSVFDCID